MNRATLFCTLFIFSLVWPFALCQAQLPAFRFETITSEDGLPTNSVLSAQRDQAGFMWFGTRLCPVRYDGARFQSFMVPETSFISSLAIDGDNNIWFASDQSGICRINIHQLKMDSLPNKTQNTPTGDFFIDSEGRGWYSDHFSVNRLDLKTHQVKNYPFRQTNFVWNKRRSRKTQTIRFGSLAGIMVCSVMMQKKIQWSVCGDRTVKIRRSGN